jgi:hypothetical protein
MDRTRWPSNGRAASDPGGGIPGRNSKVTVAHSVAASAVPETDRRSSLGGNAMRGVKGHSAVRSAKTGAHDEES